MSVILGRLLSELPDAVPASAEECKAVLAASQGTMASLQQMLAAAALSLADALLDRWAAHEWCWFRGRGTATLTPGRKKDNGQSQSAAGACCFWG